MVRLLRIWVGMMLLGLAACGGSVTLSPAPAPSAVRYLLSPGDKLTLTVFGNANLSGTFIIDDQGEVNLPLLKTVHAAGRDLASVQEEIRARLDKDFVVQPNVVLDLVNVAPIYVLGEVARPGSYPFVAKLSVRQAIALAGGYTRRADSDGVVVTRQGARGPTHFMLSPDDPLLPGDTIDVARRWF